MDTLYLLKSSISTSRFLTLVCTTLLLASLGMISHNAFADQVITTMPVGSWAAGVGVNPNTNMIYVANSKDNTVSMINGTTDTVVTSIGVGAYPIGVVVNLNTNMIYVNNNNDGTISVINGQQIVL